MTTRKRSVNEVQQETGVHLGVEAKDDFTDDIWRQRTAPMAAHREEEEEALPAA